MIIAICIVMTILSFLLFNAIRVIDECQSDISMLKRKVELLQRNAPSVSDTDETDETFKAPPHMGIWNPRINRGG